MIKRDYHSYDFVLKVCAFVLVLSIITTAWYWHLPEVYIGKIATYIQLIMFLTIAITLLINVISFKNSLEDRNRLSSIQYSNMAQSSIAEIQRMFMTNTNLDRLYREMWNYIPQNEKPSTQSVNSEVIKSEHLMSDFIFQKISEVFFTEEMEKYSDESSEWYSVFMKWLKSPILRYYWNYVRNEYHVSFQTFIDNMIRIK
jgi:hypothetical protein